MPIKIQRSSNNLYFSLGTGRVSPLPLTPYPPASAKLHPYKFTSTHLYCWGERSMSGSRPNSKAMIHKPFSGGGVLYKVLHGNGQTLYPFVYHFDRKVPLLGGASPYRPLNRVPPVNVSYSRIKRCHVNTKPNSPRLNSAIKNDPNEKHNTI